MRYLPHVWYHDMVSLRRDVSEKKREGFFRLRASFPRTDTSRSRCGGDPVRALEIRDRCASIDTNPPPPSPLSMDPRN